ncbi:helix-turn-helix domain-containing protein, partial [Streptomyces sp. NPDC004561]
MLRTAPWHTDELLTVRQVLEELGGVSRRTFYRWR